MESDGSDKDRYQPEDEEGSKEDEVESEDEAGSEKEVTSKKGNKAKPGRREIAAIRTTAPTTGLNLLLNTPNVVSGAQGQLHGIYASISRTNFVSEAEALSL